MKRLAYLAPVLLLLSCNQNMEPVSSGETLENSPKPVAEASPTSSNRVEAEAPPFVKAYFMHTWVESLYSKPANQNPNPGWISPLKDAEGGRVQCTDCHTSGQVDFTRIPKMRHPMVPEFEKDRKFMVDLMTRWVARLNSEEFLAKAKLKQEVTCVTCHETQPRL